MHACVFNTGDGRACGEWRRGQKEGLSDVELINEQLRQVSVNAHSALLLDTVSCTCTLTDQILLLHVKIAGTFLFFPLK